MTTEKIVRIGPGGDVIDALEKMLAEAKAGRWDGCILLAYDSKTRDYSRAWRGAMSLFTALGMLEAVKASCLSEVDWVSEE